MMIWQALLLWLGLNYALMARLVFVWARRDGVRHDRAFAESLLWPVTVMRVVRA